MHVYLINVCLKFGGSHNILLDSSTELRNKLLVQVAFTLGIKQIHGLPYYPTGNGCTENVVYISMSPHS